MRNRYFPVIAALWIVACTGLQTTLAAQTADVSYLTAQDTVFLSINDEGEKLVEHQIIPKQTLYSLAKFYGISIEELYFYNPGLKERAVTVGQVVLVPVPNMAIKRYKDQGFVAKEHAPVYYRVRKGDTMFRISKVFFRMPADTIKQRNGLFSDNLKEGQALFIGWMHINGVPDAWRLAAGSELDRGNAALYAIFKREAQGKKEVNEQGKAFWQKNSHEDSNLYALHRDAPINSVIQVINPMNQAVVFAKVIGRIPDTVYEREVVVVLSPLAAKQLGAQDTRFFARVKYYR